MPSFGQKIKTARKWAVIPIGVVSPRVVRYFFGAINGADCEPANNWGRLMIWARMLAYITGTVDQELLLRNEYLAAEHRILRAQIKGRLLLSHAEKATLAEIAHRLGRKALDELAAIARPETLLAWYRKVIANKFDGSKHRKSWGRPRVDEET